MSAPVVRPELFNVQQAVRRMVNERKVAAGTMGKLLGWQASQQHIDLLLSYIALLEADLREPRDNRPTVAEMDAVRAMLDARSSGFTPVTKF